ncbi:uncharacterized protein [Bombus fervidus]|uniref:uncharacterized protein n=1 Tax=Bombus fervidus TaxID=203811 RepID=UPI003AB6DCCC
MCEETKNCHAWLEPLIDKITTNLGKNFDDIRYEVSTPKESFFISSLFFVNIVSNSATDNDDEEKETSNSVVIKIPSSLDHLREMVRSEEQFHNEILFYKKYAKYYDQLPRCVYAEQNDFPNSVIVLENIVIQQGYSLCKWKSDVPLVYTIAAFREIARFHATAYMAKKNHKEEFFDFVKGIQEVRYCPGTNMQLVFIESATRWVDCLRKQSHDKQFCDKVEARFKNVYEDWILKFIEAEEPLATLCHGDFTINNMLFKNENDKLKTAFIDFALIRYGSPILDLSTFLCLHCANNIDKDMLDNVLKAYHDSLIQCLKENDIDCEQYPFEAFYEDYKKKGLFGFFIATFFLSIVMGKCEKGLEDFDQMDVPQWTKTVSQLGGDEINKILANMLLKLNDFGCLDYIL